MSYWIISLPREDMQQCLNVGKFGRNAKHTINKVAKGDQIAFVVTKEKPWKLVALGQATTSYYMDDSPLFRKKGVFPDRFDFMVSNEHETDFEPLLRSLSFITDMSFWSVHFRMGITRINEEDWSLLSRALVLS